MPQLSGFRFRRYFPTVIARKGQTLGSFTHWIQDRIGWKRAETIDV